MMPTLATIPLTTPSQSPAAARWGDGQTGRLDAATVFVQSAIKAPAFDPDFRTRAEAWRGLPTALKASIMAMVRASEEGAI